MLLNTVSTPFRILLKKKVDFRVQFSFKVPYAGPAAAQDNPEFSRISPG